MKHMKNIITQKVYIVEYFYLYKTFLISKQDLYNVNGYKDVEIINHSSYKKKWAITIYGEKNLRKKLKSWYKKELSLSFYTSLDEAIKIGYNFDYLIIKPLGNSSSFNTFKLRNRKATNLTSPKKHKKYYCDCYRCVGMTKMKYKKQYIKDELKLN